VAFPPSVHDAIDALQSEKKTNLHAIEERLLQEDTIPNGKEFDCKFSTEMLGVVTIATSN
jgi:hypothetical protein